ncbi:MAG: hypothetical protein U0559_01240 [Anaerolineae bacterium]
MNIADKDNLKYALRTFTPNAQVHRLPLLAEQSGAITAQFSENLAHLQYDPRRLEIGEYVQKPDHNFARGQSAQFNVSPN